MSRLSSTPPPAYDDLQPVVAKLFKDDMQDAQDALTKIIDLTEDELANEIRWCFQLDPDVSITREATSDSQPVGDDSVDSDSATVNESEGEPSVWAEIMGELDENEYQREHTEYSELTASWTEDDFPAEELCSMALKAYDGLSKTYSWLAFEAGKRGLPADQSLYHSHHIVSNAAYKRLSGYKKILETYRSTEVHGLVRTHIANLQSTISEGTNTLYYSRLIDTCENFATRANGLDGDVLESRVGFTEARNQITKLSVIAWERFEEQVRTDPTLMDLDSEEEAMECFRLWQDYRQKGLRDDYREWAVSRSTADSSTLGV